MKHRHAIFRSRLGLALCFMLAGGAIIPQSSVLKAETSVTQQSRKITGTITDTKGAVSYTHLTLPTNREV